MVGYAKISPGENKEAKESLFQKYDCNKVVIDDSRNPKAKDGIWESIKRELLLSDEELLLDSIYSLGKTGREIHKELNWIIDNDIKLYIVSIPTSFKNPNLSRKILWELFNDKATTERKNVAERQREGQTTAIEANVRFGRPVTPYPPNWKEDYDLWRNKEISTVEFMERTKLKKGTFYNLIKRYKKELESHNQETDVIG